jgi:hypothetical protein
MSLKELGSRRGTSLTSMEKVTNLSAGYSNPDICYQHTRKRKRQNAWLADYLFNRQTVEKVMPPKTPKYFSNHQMLIIAVFPLLSSHPTTSLLLSVCNYLTHIWTEQVVRHPIV